MRSDVFLFVNGRERRVAADHAFLTLSTWLRQIELATGTKVVCEEGDCGACTVLVGRLNQGAIHYAPINSCIQLVAQLDGTHVVTVEGLARDRQLSVMQEKMVAHHGAQCGYCTPGFVVAMTALGEEKKKWDEDDVRLALSGNLCRCTGYTPIIEAAMAASGQKAPSMNELYAPGEIIERLSAVERESLLLELDGRRFFSPATLDEALRFRSENRDAVIVQGGTDVGVLANKRSFAPPTFMNLAHVRELFDVMKSSEMISVGANVTLTRLEEETKKLIPELHQILRLFGAPQIRNAGTVAGNIANGSPIADLLPFLYVSGASVELSSVRGRRTIEVGKLYKGYKELDLEADELITRIDMPLPGPGETLKLYKVSKRRDLDISSFTAALRMSIRSKRISSVRIAFGGVGPTVVRLPKTEALLEGSELGETLFRDAGEEARREITPISDVRGSADFRFQLAENIFMKFFDEVSEE